MAKKKTPISSRGGESIGQVDAHALNWHTVFTDAVKFRLQPAKPSSPNTITITREVFDRLLAVVDAACRAADVPPGIEEMSARQQDGKHIVTRYS